MMLVMWTKHIECLAVCLSIQLSIYLSACLSAVLSLHSSVMLPVMVGVFHMNKHVEIVDGNYFVFALLSRDNASS
jgi:hypothetical protein